MHAFMPEKIFSPIKAMNKTTYLHVPRQDARCDKKRTWFQIYCSLQTDRTWPRFGVKKSMIAYAAQPELLSEKIIKNKLVTFLTYGTFLRSNPF